MTEFSLHKQSFAGLNANQIKIIAIIAMTIDHLTSVIFPYYPTSWWILALHIIGRVAAPIMWFFIAEGFHYTRDIKKYALRLFAFAIVSHFAYNFAFGIPFIPFQTFVFNQTSVIWSLAWGLVALAISQSKNPNLRQWMKVLLILGITIITFCADWSSIAVLAIVQIGTHRGNFKRQMIGMVAWVAVYATVYAIFINPIYGIIQLFVVLSIPILKAYSGQQCQRGQWGTWSGMKWFFYLYYPIHLIIIGIIRTLLHGDVGVMIGS